MSYNFTTTKTTNWYDHFYLFISRLIFIFYYYQQQILVCWLFNSFEYKQLSFQFDSINQTIFTLIFQQILQKIQKQSKNNFFKFLKFKLLIQIQKKFTFLKKRTIKIKQNINKVSRNLYLVKKNIKQKMKQSLQRKINAYRQAKSTKQSFDSYLDQKKKNLKNLLEQQLKHQSTSSQTQPDFLKLQKQNKFSSTSQFNKKLELKQQEYFRQMQEIQNLKLQAIQKNNDLENLKIQLSFQKKGFDNMVERFKQEKKQNQQLIQKIVEKQLKQIKETKGVYAERIKKNFQHYEQLLGEKQQQCEKREQFLLNKRKFQKDFKELKQNHEKALKDNRQLWAQQETQYRQNWQKKKKAQIMQNTLKGIQPQIQRIVGSGKQQIKRIQQKYHILRQQYKDQKQKQFQKKAIQLRNESFSQIQSQKMKILSQYSQKLKQQFQYLQEQFEKDRKKIRSQREEEIKQLQEKRKNQTEEFILKNKDFYTIHLEQVKKIKQEYESQIRELDGKFELEIQKQEDYIRARYNDKLQKQRETKRKQLEKKIKQFTVGYQKQSQSMYEDLVEKVAVDNQVYQSQIRRKTEEKLKDIRETFQNQIKHLKKTINVIQNKINTLNKDYLVKKQQRQNNQQVFNEIKRENQYLQKKHAEYLNDLHIKKVSIQNNSDIQNHPTILKIHQQWTQQIAKAKQSYQNIKKQSEQSEDIIIQKIAELRNKYTEATNVLEKNSLKFLELKNGELQKLRHRKQMQIRQGEALDEMLKKQKAMLERFQEQQRNVSSRRGPTNK